MVCWLNGFILQYRKVSSAFGPKISIFRSKQQRLYGDGLEKSDLFTSVRQKLLCHSIHQRLWLLEHVTFVSLMNYASMALRFFYHDETWCNQNEERRFVWTDGTGIGRLRNSQNNGNCRFLYLSTDHSLLL